MSESYESLPLADGDRERNALELFPCHELPEVYAARNAHLWMTFSFDDYRYRDPELTRWLQRLGDLFFQRGDVPSIKQLRLQYLSAEERLQIEAVETEQRRGGDL